MYMEIGLISIAICRAEPPIRTTAWTEPAVADQVSEGIFLEIRISISMVAIVGLMERSSGPALHLRRPP